MRILIGITTLSRQNKERSKHIKNEIKIQQTREIRIEKIRTEKAEQKKAGQEGTERRCRYAAGNK